MYCLNFLWKGGGIASGDFNYAKRRFNLSTSVRCTVWKCLAMSLLAFCRKRHRHPHHIRFLGRLLTYPLFYTHPPQDSLDLSVLLRLLGPRSETLEFVAILVTRGAADNTPWRHSTANFVTIYSGDLEASGDILGHHLLQESLPDCFSKFLCVRSLSTSILINC
jgi:hypothetical protein